MGDTYFIPYFPVGKFHLRMFFTSKIPVSCSENPSLPIWRTLCANSGSLFRIGLKVPFVYTTYFFFHVLKTVFFFVVEDTFTCQIITFPSLEHPSRSANQKDQSEELYDSPKVLDSQCGAVETLLPVQPVNGLPLTSAIVIKWQRVGYIILWTLKVLKV